jgi:hypothetical protein
MQILGYFGHRLSSFLMRLCGDNSVKLGCGGRNKVPPTTLMEIVTPKSLRRSTRLRVEIPVTVTSLDRRHAFVAECVALIVSPQGAGLQAPQGLPVETPVMLSGLPGGASASGRVASSLPLGSDGKHFLIGVSLYNPGNVWGIAQPPEDWNCAAAASAAPGASASGPDGHVANSRANTGNVWPYNVFSGHSETHPRQK